jgi:hypothetical protein
MKEKNKETVGIDLDIVKKTLAKLQNKNTKKDNL